MAQHSPTGFAFGMLLEIAAVVVIVSLLPRFDLRPPAQAEERFSTPSEQRTVDQASFTTAAPSVSVSRAAFNASPPLLSNDQTALNRQKDVAERPRLAVHEVEERLDRASQQLVNTLGTTAANWSSDVRYAAGRPTLPPPPSIAPAWAGSQRPTSQPPAMETPARRRWLNY